MGDLKFGLKLALLSFFLIASLITSDNPKLQFLVYLPSIPMSSAVILFTPFFKRFSGFFVETPNVFASYNSFARPDGLYIYTFLEFLLLVALVYHVIARKFSKYRALLIFLVVFVVFNFLTVFVALNATRAFFQSLHLALSLSMFYFSLQLWGDEKYEEFVVSALIVIILLTVADVINLDSIKMLLSGKWLVRSAGRFNTANPPAHLAGMGIIFSLYLGFKKRIPVNLLFFGIAGILLLVIFCTGSRNGLISTVAASSVFLFFILKTQRKYNLVLVSLAVVLFALVSYNLGRVVFQLRLNPELLLFDTSVLSRFLLWRNSFRYFLAHPFSPVGTGNFFYFEGSLGLPFAHNFLINLLVESGVIPFLMAIWVYLLGIKKIFTKVVAFIKSSDINKEELVSVAFILYMMLIFSADQFLFDGSLWRFMLIFLSFSVSKLWGSSNKDVSS